MTEQVIDYNKHQAQAAQDSIELLESKMDKLESEGRMEEHAKYSQARIFLIYYKQDIENR